MTTPQILSIALLFVMMGLFSARFDWWRALPVWTHPGVAQVVVACLISAPS